MTAGAKPQSASSSEPRRRGDRGARDRLVGRAPDSCAAIASRYRDLGLPVDDLIQEGSIGLLEAIDPTTRRQIDFEAFARFRIRRAIRNALTDKRGLIRLPKQIVERRRMLARPTRGSRPRTAGRPHRSSSPRPGTGAPLGSRGPAAGDPRCRWTSRAPDGSTLEILLADPSAPTRRRRRCRSSASDCSRRRPPPAARQRSVVTRRFGLAGEETPIAALADELGLSERRDARSNGTLSTGWARHSGRRGSR